MVERWSVGENMEGCVRKGGGAMKEREKQNEGRQENRLIHTKYCRQADNVEGNLLHDVKEEKESRT